VSASRNQSDWSRLLRVAQQLIRQVNSDALIIDHWTLGGGTALMLQINHRESHDIDLFLTDPQLLSYLDPEKRDFNFEISLTGSYGDGTGFLKLTFDGIGQIDFIVAQHKTSNPTIEREIEGEVTLLETIAEIVVKKIVHRGSSMQPRDIFDIAAAGQHHAAALVAELRPYQADVAKALEFLEGLKREFVNHAISELLIRQEFAAVARTAFDRAKQILRAV